jgi:hypothetical protein
LASIHQEFTKLKLPLELHGTVDKTLAQQFEYSGLHRQQKRHLVTTLRALTETSRKKERGGKKKEEKKK